ncbi:MAG: hypothetical protein ABDH37_00890 [Candidatus Hydrothermales bacterium]
MIILLFFYALFDFKPSSFLRLTGSADLNFFSSTSFYPSLISFFDRNFLFYFDYRNPYSIKEWNEVHFSLSFKKFAFLTIFQKKLKNYSETEFLLGFAKKIRSFALSTSLNYLLLNSSFKNKASFDFDVGSSFVKGSLVLSFNIRHILNSFESKDYHICLNYSPIEKFNIFISKESEIYKTGFYLFLKPISIFLSFSENFTNTGIGLSFEDRAFMISLENNSYLGLSTGATFELKR